MIFYGRSKHTIGPRFSGFGGLLLAEYFLAFAPKRGQFSSRVAISCLLLHIEVFHEFPCLAQVEIMFLASTQRSQLNPLSKHSTDSLRNIEATEQKVLINIPLSFEVLLPLSLKPSLL